MPAEIDPLSQLIGTLQAQTAEVGRSITDLRAEVITNRSQSQSWRDDLLRQLDLVHSEYRDVKHAARHIEQVEVALDARLRRIESRLDDIEKMILVWRTRLALLAGFGVAVGALAGSLINAGLSAIFRWLLP